MWLILFETMAKQDFQKKVELNNKRASFEYFFLDKYTAGLVLQGTEIKSIRLSKANLTDAYCVFLENELYVRGMHISKYELGTYANHEPLRDRKLLLSKKELAKLANKLKDQGLTIVPTKLYINEKGLAKLDIALAKGKKLYDKRDTIKDKDIKRDMDRRNN